MMIKRRYSWSLTFFSGLSIGLHLLFLICCSWSNFMVTSSMESCSRSQNPARSWEVGLGMALGSYERDIGEVTTTHSKGNDSVQRTLPLHWLQIISPATCEHTGHSKTLSLIHMVSLSDLQQASILWCPDHHLLMLCHGPSGHIRCLWELKRSASDSDEINKHDATDMNSKAQMYQEGWGVTHSFHPDNWSYVFFLHLNIHTSPEHQKIRLWHKREALARKSWMSREGLGTPQGTFCI